MAITMESLESRQFLSAAPDIGLSAARLVFAQPQNTTSAAQYVTVSNRGKATLNLSSITVTGTNASNFSLRLRGVATTLKPGSAVSIRVLFTPTSETISDAALRIGSNDPDSPVVSVGLRGLGTAGLYATLEPSLQSVLDAFQIPVQVGDSTPHTPGLNGPAPSDEIAMPFLKKAGPGPVRITPIAAFSWNTDPVAEIGWYRAKGTPVLQKLFSINKGSGQVANPAYTGTTTFDPLDRGFGLYSTWPSQTHGTVYTDDARNSWNVTDQGHMFRFYPYRRANGKQIANTYVVGFEQGTNSDYQDAVAIIENVAPVSIPAMPTNLAITAVGKTTVDLSWTDQSNNESLFIIERATRRNGPYVAIGAVTVNKTTYHDSNLAPGRWYYYRVRAVNGAGSSLPTFRVSTSTLPG